MPYVLLPDFTARVFVCTRPGTCDYADQPTSDCARGVAALHADGRYLRDYQWTQDVESLPDPIDLSPNENGDTTMTEPTDANAVPAGITARHLSRDARTVTFVAETFWNAASYAQRFPAPHILQARYNSGGQDTYILTEFDRDAETFSGYFLHRHETGEPWRGPAVPHTRDAFEGAVIWWVLAFEQPEPESELGTVEEAEPDTGMFVWDACAQAGIGGTVTRYNETYTVGRTPDGWTLMCDAFGSLGPQHTAVFVADGWQVTEIATAATEPATEQPEREPQQIGRWLPRTAQEAQDMINALAFLKTRLPGGEFEQKAVDIAEETNLCGIYDRVVSEAFGFSPRDGHYSDAAGGTERWERHIARIERDHMPRGLLPLLYTAAERYHRGGVVNEAIIDAMRDNLESHKWAAVSEALEACDMDGIARNHTYRVTARLTRRVATRGTVEQSQYVTVEVTDQPDEDSALEYARHHIDLTDQASAYNWTTDWDTQSESDDVDESHDDDYEEDWDDAEVELED